MKALSVQNPYANLIVKGLKKLEIRSRSTNYRGEILICVSKKNVSWRKINPMLKSDYNESLYLNNGSAIGIVTIANCRPMTKEDESEAWCEYKEGLYAYELENPRAIKPFDVSGKLGFYEVEVVDEKIFSEQFYRDGQKAFLLNFLFYIFFMVVFFSVLIYKNI